MPNIKLPDGNSINFDDKVTGLLSSIHEEFIIVSKNGKGFISNTESLVTNQKKGKQLFNLKNNDVVIKVINLTKKHIACVTKLQKMLMQKDLKKHSYLFQLYLKLLFLNLQQHFYFYPSK